MPRTVVTAIYLHSSAVGLDGRRCVLELSILVAHESPSRDAARVELDSFLEVDDGLSN